jgi:hypothetical protein
VSSTTLLRKVHHDRAVTPQEHEALLKWLEEGPSHNTVGVLLRKESGYHEQMESLPDGDASLPYLVQDACARALEQIHDRWWNVVGSHSFWANINCYPLLGLCSLRGPSDDLRRLFESPINRDSDSPVAGYIYGNYLSTSESVGAAMAEKAHARNVLETFGRDCFDIGRSKLDKGRVGEIAHSEVLFAALYGSRIDTRRWDDVPPEEPDPLDELCRHKSEFEYLNQLKLGDAKAWGEGAGKRQAVCVIDSGAEESHPVLHEQVAHYLRLDVMGYQKTAHDCTDNACHGTKISGAICGKPVDLARFRRQGIARIGLAPGAKLVVISALNGDFKQECGTFDQLFAGMEHAVKLSSRYGHSIVNISMEPNGPLAPSVASRIDELLQQLKRYEMVPILAAGNHGANSRPLGTSGYYIGALAPDGAPSPHNGPRVDLLAPGKLICAHPISMRLNNMPFGWYSGSSLSAALIAASVAIVASAKQIPAHEAMNRLLASAADDLRPNIDRAVAL